MKNLLLPTILIVLFLASCKEKSHTLVDNYIYVQKENRSEKNWKVVWQDNFDSPELDTTKWTRIPPNSADWGNYMTSDDKCYKISNGKMLFSMEKLRYMQNWNARKVRGRQCGCLPS